MNLLNHLFLDGYGSPQKLAEDAVAMTHFLQDIKDSMFHGSGEMRIVPIIGGTKPQNDGVSGIVLASGGHFTCHTFSQRGIFFADAISIRRFEREPIKAVTEEHLRPQTLKLCQADSDAPGFGRHLILHIPRRTPAESHEIISAIVSAIHMTNLCERMEIVKPENFSIIQPITESHISLHSVGPNAILDVFSCKDFSPDDVLRTLHEFGIAPLQMSSVGRGLDLKDKTL